MRLKTKISLPWFFIVVLAISTLGFWSASIIQRNLDEESHAILSTILSSYVNEVLQQRQDILETNNLQSVPSYVKHYQQSAMEAAGKIDFYWPGWVMAYDRRGNLIFTTDSLDNGNPKQFWQQNQSRLSGLAHGEMVRGNFADGQFFLSTYYQPWGWYLTAVVDQAALRQSVREVRMATLFWIAGVIVVSILFLAWITRFVLISPINKLRRAAAEISSGNYIDQVSVRSGDDLGDLARDIETMSTRIQEKERQLQEANDQLELRVQERTRELSARNTELDHSQVKLRAAIEELKNQRDLSQMYLDIAGVMLVSLDSTGTITLINKKGCALLGYREAELLGANWFETCLPWGVREKAKEVFEQLMAGDIPVVEYYENDVLRKNGEIRTLAVHNTITRDSAGNVSGVFSSGEDITERKKSETEKDKLQNQLIQAQKMESVGRLAGGVAHDFNNMLSVILGNTELALHRVGSETEMQDLLHEIHQAAGRSAEITRQLLAFARRQTINPQVLDLNETVEGMLKMLRRLIGENIDLLWKPGRGVWPLKIDPSQLDQILANLCVNARDAIVDVGRITIETDNVRFDEEYCADHPGFVVGEYVMLAVSDDGHGMDKRTQEKIFEPFYTTKDVTKGTGLGLATVYGIVKQNEGFINVYSEPEKGTTFRIYFACHSKVAVRVEKSVTAEILRGSGESVLVVEDEAAILKLTRRILENLGYTVLQAANPTEAIARVKELSGEVDLLITDVVMPEMNGRDLAKKLQVDHPKLKVLFMSGYTANVIAHHGVLDSGVQFIQKPFAGRDLALKIREVLRE